MSVRAHTHTYTGVITTSGRITQSRVLSLSSLESSFPKLICCQIHADTFAACVLDSDHYYSPKDSDQEMFIFEWMDGSPERDHRRCLDCDFRQLFQRPPGPKKGSAGIRFGLYLLCTKTGLRLNLFFTKKGLTTRPGFFDVSQVMCPPPPNPKSLFNL